MLRELRAFLQATSSPLELDAYRVEHEIEPFWVGRPAKAPYAVQMAAAVACGALGTALYLSHGAFPVLLSGLLVALLYPMVAALDWYTTEYLLTADLVVVKPGAFSRSLRVHDLGDCAGVEEEAPRFAKRLGYRNLHLVKASEEDAERERLATLRHVPANVAEGFLDVLDLLEDDCIPDQEMVISAPSRPTESESPEATRP
jgi:uncharacterized membrane protein YdbT with pleckstrin-like domain